VTPTRRDDASSARGVELLTDRSIPTRRGVVVASVATGGFLLLLLYTLYNWKVRKIYQPMELLLAASFLVLMMNRALTRYTVEMKRDALRITSKGILGTKILDIPYDAVVGVYAYRPKLVGPVRFRRTLRMHTSVDGRDVWSIAFQTRKGNGKKENLRVYFKCSEALLDGLALLMPGRVRVPENVVMANIIKSE
jgi:hypothetical protein